VAEELRYGLFATSFNQLDAAAVLEIVMPESNFRRPQRISKHLTTTRGRAMDYHGAASIVVGSQKAFPALTRSRPEE